jgi:hypothetical protein
MKLPKVHSLAALMRKPVREVASFNRCTIGVASFSRHPTWERHPDGDEVLQVLDGQLDLTLLTEDGPFETTLRAGSLFVPGVALQHRAARLLALNRYSGAVP